MGSKEIIIKSNHLIEAKYKLSMREQKIILFLISQIEKNDEDLKMYTISIKNFSEMMGLKGKPKYEEIRSITDELLKKILRVREGPKTYTFHWLSLVIYNEKEGTIDMRFDPILKPYLMDLKRDFTKLNLKNILILRSGNSIRVYELLKQYLAIRERTIKLNDLKNFLGLDETGYEKYADFKRKVIVPAMKEINEKTDITFDFKEIKDGRKVTALRFLIQSKTSEIKKTEELSEPPEDPFYQQVKETFQQNAYELTKAIFDKWVQAARKIWSDKSEEEINSLIHTALKKRNIQNHIAFVTYILNEKVKCVESGKDHLEINVKNNYQHPIREELLPKWYREQKEGEQLSLEEDPVFLEEKAKLEADLKARKSSSLL